MIASALAAFIHSLFCVYSLFFFFALRANFTELSNKSYYEI